MSDIPIPKCNQDHDLKNYGKASLRMKKILASHGLPLGKPEAKRIVASDILPSPFNRLGRPLNLQYIHKDLAPNLVKEGWQENRPSPGFVVTRTKEPTLKRLHEHNAKMHESYGGLLPPLMVGDRCNKECLGGNHLTMTLRMFRTNYSSPITGQTFSVPDDDDGLKTAVEVGHHYYELNDDISDEDCIFLSEMLNSDQNQNQCNSEDHLRELIVTSIASLITPSKPTVSTTDIIEKVCRESVVKLRPDHVGDMAQYVVQFHNSPYNTELTKWYAENVNPRELTVSAKWFADIAKAFGKQRPLTKLAATFVQYRGITITTQARPNPDLSRTLDLPLLNSLAGKDVDKLDEVEEFLVNARIRFEKYLAEKLSKEKGIRHIHNLSEAAMRLLCSKSLEVPFQHSVSGKYSAEKLNALETYWVKDLQAKNPSLGNMLKDFGIKDDEDDKNATGEVRMISWKCLGLS